MFLEAGEDLAHGCGVILSRGWTCTWIGFVGMGWRWRRRLGTIKHLRILLEYLGRREHETSHHFRRTGGEAVDDWCGERVCVW